MQFPEKTLLRLLSTALTLGLLAPALADDPGQPTPEALWKQLEKSEYRHWGPWPGQDGNFYEGQEPHGALLKVYANRTALGQPADPPHGSIVIKENYSPEKKLMAITVMQRVKGYDAAHHDWYWAKFDGDGRVAEMGGKPLAGKVTGCIQCHGSADGEDYRQRRVTHRDAGAAPLTRSVTRSHAAGSRGCGP